MGRKKKHAGGHGNSERWLLTYADMITLLVAFFVMLYSLSILDMKKFQAVAGALRMNFGGAERTTPVGESLILSGMPSGDNAILGKGSHARKFDVIAGALRKLVAARGLSKSISIMTQERGVLIRIAAEGLLFERGRADLQSEAYPVIDKLAEILEPTKYLLRVEGHTCDIPINTARFPSNWELSASRAGSVVRFLVLRGLDPRRLSAVGYADSHPVAANASEEGRVKNRRVDILVLDNNMPENNEPFLPELPAGADQVPSPEPAEPPAPGAPPAPVPALVHDEAPARGGTADSAPGPTPTATPRSTHGP